MAIETEMKLRMPNETVIDEIMHDPYVTQYLIDPFTEIKMNSVFYDTADFDLHKSRMMLRVRHDGHHHIATVKGSFQNVNIKDPTGISVRQEWSCMGEDPREAVKKLVEDGAPEKILEAIGDKPLVEYCRAAFSRHAAVLHMDEGVRVEMALDAGRLYCCEEDQTPILELELELLFGDINALPPFAAKLVEKYELEPEVLSKHGRALGLIGKLELD